MPLLMMMPTLFRRHDDACLLIRRCRRFIAAIFLTFLFVMMLDADADFDAFMLRAADITPPISPLRRCRD